MTHITVLSCFHSASMAVRTILYFTVSSTRQILSFQVQRVRPVSETNNFEVLILSKKNIRIVTPIIRVMTSREPGVPKILSPTQCCATQTKPTQIISKHKIITISLSSNFIYRHSFNPRKLPICPKTPMSDWFKNKLYILLKKAFKSAIKLSIMQSA